VRDAQALAEFNAAYARLVTAAHRAVQRFFRYDPSYVDDAVAETMVRTFERWERVRRHENQGGWVVVCAKHVCLEQLRKAERRSAGANADADRYVSGDDFSDEIPASLAIARALDQLSKRQRDVAVLRYLMDYDEVTTATALGMTVSKVKSAAHEARNRLRLLLEEVYGDGTEVAT
jgi:RNA polymerase sigma factor (sigma-70 family)